jgi:hypothetical protein
LRPQSAAGSRVRVKAGVRKAETAWTLPPPQLRGRCSTVFSRPLVRSKPRGGSPRRQRDQLVAPRPARNGTVHAGEEELGIFEDLAPVIGNNGEEGSGSGHQRVYLKKERQAGIDPPRATGRTKATRPDAPGQSSVALQISPRRPRGA